MNKGERILSFIDLSSKWFSEVQFLWLFWLIVSLVSCYILRLIVSFEYVDVCH